MKTLDQILKDGKGFLILVLFFIYSIALNAQINLNQGLRAGYDFTGNADDITGNGFDGTVNGATLISDRFGNSNSAYHFDHYSFQNIEVQGFQTMIPGDELSMSVWVKADTVTTQGVFTLFPDDQFDRIFAGPYYDHNHFSSTFWDYGDISNNGRLGSVGTYFQSCWEHYVYIVSASQNMMQVYRNGYLQFMKSGISHLINKNRTFCIGGNWAGVGGAANCYFTGSIDDIRIYDRVLNPAEVMALNHCYYTSDVKDLRVFVTNYPNARPGFPDFLNVVYQNVGNNAISNVYVELNYDTNYSFVLSMPVQDSSNTNYLGWHIPNLLPGAQGYFQVEVSLPATVPLGTQLGSSAVIYPLTYDSIPINNYDTLVQTVVGGCDPNYIEVSPGNEVTKNFVENENYFYYTLHFQNTGTASAINIRVQDSLESDFIVSSVEVIGASHPYTFTLDNSNRLNFVFDNINLPDSGADYAGSNGFVLYKIKALPSLNIGDQLSNAANIYFDFNQPVQTNTVVTTIVNPLSVNEMADTKDFFNIYPNPSNNNFILNYTAIRDEKINIQIVNTAGAQVKEIKCFTKKGSNKIDLNINAVKAGIYFIKISNSDKTVVQKLMKL